MGVLIEKNKSIPSRDTWAKRAKYPWSEMKVGESFLVDVRQWAFGSLANYNKKMKARKQKQIKIETRTEGNKCRVWRIK